LENRTVRIAMPKETPNVIVVVIDALRARNLGCMGFGNDASPELDALARSGVLFERAFSTWNTTDPSLTCILTGKYPRSHGITDHGDRATEAVRGRFAEGGTKLTAEVLKEAGYETAAVDWMGRWFKRGFDQYGFRPEGSLGQKLAHRVRLPALYWRYALDHLPILQCYRPVRRPGLKDLAEGMKGVLSTFAFTYRLAEIQDAGSVTRLGSSSWNVRARSHFSCSCITGTRTRPTTAPAVSCPRMQDVRAGKRIWSPVMQAR